MNLGDKILGVEIDECVIKKACSMILHANREQFLDQTKDFPYNKIIIGNEVLNVNRSENPKFREVVNKNGSYRGFIYEYHIFESPDIDYPTSKIVEGGIVLSMDGVKIGIATI